VQADGHLSALHGPQTALRRGRHVARMRRACYAQTSSASSINRTARACSPESCKINPRM
jgi:hypothetical protein